MTISDLIKIKNDFRLSKISFYFFIKFLFSSFLFLFLFEKIVQYKESIKILIHIDLLKNYYSIFILIWLSVIWFFIYIFIDWIFQKFSFLWSSRSYKFIPSHWPKQFIFEGGSHINNNKLVINQSSGGLLIKDRFWKNFRAKFNFNFNTSDSSKKKPVFGFLFRAQNLENYLMFQFSDDQNKFLLNPHIRVNGNWQRYKHENNYLSGFDKNKEHNLEITVINNYVNIELDNNYFSDFYLPTNYSVRSHRERNEDDKKDFLDPSSVNKIFFGLDYGNIGFRCWDSEWVEICNLEIEPIRWWKK